MNPEELYIECLHGFMGSPLDFKPIEEAYGKQSRRKTWFRGAPWTSPSKGFNRRTPRGQCSNSTPSGNETAFCEPSRRIELGYSQGGRYGLSRAIECQWPSRLFVGIGVTPGPIGRQQRFDRRSQEIAWIDHIETRGVNSFLDYWEALPIFDSQRENIPQNIYKTMWERRRGLSAEEIIHQIRTWGQGHMESLWDDLHRIEIPVLLVTGEHDAKYTEIAEQMLERLPDAEHVVVPNAGHAPHLENLDHFVQVLDNFIERRLFPDSVLKE